MHYGLAHLEESFYGDNLYKVVSLAPCWYSGIPDVFKDFYNSTFMTFQEHGIYSLNGPDWPETLEKICTDFPGYWCDTYTTNQS